MGYPDSANNATGSFANAKTAPATDGSAVGQVDIQQVFIQGFRQEAAAVADNHRGMNGWNWLSNWIDGNVPRPDSSAEGKIASVLGAAVGMMRGKVPKILFGRVENQISHTFRHVEKAGFDRDVVQQAVTQDLSRMANSLSKGQQYTGAVHVNGTKIEYSAFKLENGTINVGRITPPRP